MFFRSVNTVSWHDTTVYGGMTNLFLVSPYIRVLITRILSSKLINSAVPPLSPNNKRASLGNTLTSNAQDS